MRTPTDGTGVQDAPFAWFDGTGTGAVILRLPFHEAALFVQELNVGREHYGAPAGAPTARIPGDACIDDSLVAGGRVLLKVVHGALPVVGKGQRVPEWELRG